jgi:hypothetical protein
MASSLTELFDSMKRSLEQDRDVLNDLDGDGVGDGDTGDNMVANFETITNALREADTRGAPVDQALTYASQVLQEQGKGSTAPIYASGLREAASNLQGKTSFGLDDIGGLLSGLLGGAQQAPGVKNQGGGGILDGLLPGVMSFMQARNAGKSTIEALLSGFMGAQRGAYGTTRSNQGFQDQQTQTQGRVDPGAAGASSLLGGLFSALLSGGLSAGRGEPAQSPGLGELFGGAGGLGQLFGGGGGGALGGLGQLLGGGARGGEAGSGGAGDILGGLGQMLGGGSSRGNEPSARLGDKEVT